MTSKQYIQLWRAFKHKNGPLNKVQIWKFQKSILSKEEQYDSIRLCLYMDKDDPRCDVMDISDVAYNTAPL